ncbi:MAG: DUF2029 domain-containing protein [Nitrospina sp.]|nr:MAG: DUF2029 domain-containing protein [Nitrospina sp.]
MVQSITIETASQENKQVRRIRITGWILFSVVGMAVGSGTAGMGLTWDESMAHFWGSEVFRAWLSHAWDTLLAGQWSVLWDPAFHGKYWPPVTPENQKFFNFNYHPALTRILPTLTWFVFHGWFGDIVAYRMAPAILFALAVMAVFRVMARRFDSATGLFAALSLALMPRVFGHAHIAATDTAMMAFWLFAVVAFYKGLEDKRWSYGFAVLLGLAFSVKFTGVLIPLALIMYMILAREKRAWRNVVVAAVISPVVLIALNPTWWVDPFSGFFTHYVQTALSRNTTAPIATYYLGELYPVHAPWHYSLVMTAVTVPVAILLFVLLGAVWGVRQRADKWVLLVLSQLIFYYLILVLPLSPDYDGVRLFLPVFPFLACLAGLGYRGLRDWVFRNMDRWPPLIKWGRKRIVALIFLITFTWPALQLADSHPFYLEYYNGLTGGVAGAHRAGFETTYWFDTVVPSVRDTINRFPLNSRVGVLPPVVDYLRYMQDHGLLRQDLVFTQTDMDYIILLPRQSKFRDFTWDLYHRQKPVFKLSLEGVPLLLIYRKPD